MLTLNTVTLSAATYSSFLRIGPEARMSRARFCGARSSVVGNLCTIVGRVRAHVPRI